MNEPAAKTEGAIRVVIAGAAGRMGRQVVAAVTAEPDMEIVAAVDNVRAREDAGDVAGIGGIGVKVRTNLYGAIDDTSPDVMVDFTTPTSVMRNVTAALERSVACVVGTTGHDCDDLHNMAVLATKMECGVIVAPNFSIGAVLMMKAAEMATRHFKKAEIIELHHDKKLDAPSGTSLMTASRMAEAGGLQPPIHSVRLPGLVAHQEVIFGGNGETLTIRHDTTDRSCFMPGVLLAIRKVRERKGLVCGIDKLLGL
jgi:4-hydroxy-tetrahydrodipicolinate reductase